MRRTYLAVAAVAVHVGTTSPWGGDSKDARGYVDAAGHRIPHVVLASIQDASRQTGISFGYLMAQAGRESAFRSDAGSRLSSAAGLYQFTASTWLMMMKEHGAAYGYGELADKIGHRRGEFVVDGPGNRTRILELRRDARLSALMAGEYAKDNRNFLEQKLGRKVNTADLYLAHFLGPAGALRFLQALARDPQQPADGAITANAARNNATIFYDSRRHVRSVAAVYDVIRTTIDRPAQAYAHLEDARAYAAAWTENIETSTDRVVGAVPPPAAKPAEPAPVAVAQAETAGAARFVPPVPEPKPEMAVLLAGRFVPPVPAAKPAIEAAGEAPVAVARFEPPVPEPKPDVTVLLAGRFVPPVPGVKPDPLAVQVAAAEELMAEDRRIELAALFVPPAMPELPQFGPDLPPEAEVALQLAMEPEQRPVAAETDGGAVVMVALNDLIVSAARIDHPMPPPAGSAAAELRYARPFGWLLAPLRSLFGTNV